jgi:hypothetical protein
MKALIPCFRSSYIPFVGGETLLGHLERLAAVVLEAENIDGVIVASDDGALRERLRERRVSDVLPAESPDDEGRSMLPPGSASALRAFLAVHGNERVLVANWNLIGVTPAFVDRMAREVEARDATVCGVLSEKGNPCRYNLYRRLTDMDVVLRLQPANDSSARVSAPVHWDNPEDISSIRFSCRVVSACASCPEPRPGFGPIGLRAAREASSASFLFDPSHVDGAVDSVNLFGSRTVLTDRGPSRSRVLKISEGDFPDADFLLIVPFDGSGFIPGAKRTVKPLKGRETLVEVAAPQCSGVAILSGNNISDGIYHSKTHFPAIDGVLRWEGNNAYNCKTGKLVHGRQEFPDIFSAMGVFSGGYASDLAEGVTLEDGPYGVPLPEGISLLRTQLDLIGERMDCGLEPAAAASMVDDACLENPVPSSLLREDAALEGKLFAFDFLINKTNDTHLGGNMAEFNELRYLRDAVNAELVNARINALRAKQEPGRCNGRQRGD